MISRIDALESRRLLSGTLAQDLSFGDAGVGRATAGPSEAGNVALVEQLAGGKILMVGATAADNTGRDPNVIFSRLNANGTADITFGPSGSVVALPDLAISAAAVQSDGKIVVAGVHDNEISVARLSPEGVPDTSFGVQGVTVISVAGASDDLTTAAIAIAPDGKIIAAGIVEASDNDFGNFVLARLTTAGALDTTFNGTGMVRDTRPGFIDSAAIVVQSDKKILVVGREDDVAFAARYTAAGAADAGFGTAGFTDLPRIRAGGDLATAVAIQSDGKIVVGGEQFIDRLTSTGALDSTFGTNGVAAITQSSIFDPIPAQLIIGHDGKINAVDGSLLIRLNSDGTLDSSLHSDDVGDGALPVGFGTALAEETNGDILVASNLPTITGSDFAVAQIAPQTLGDVLGPFGLLVITGDAHNDIITIDVVGDKIHVDHNNPVSNFHATTDFVADKVTSINIDSDGGTNQIASSVDLPTTVLSGAASDIITTGDAADSITSGGGGDQITSGGGDDTIFVTNTKNGDNQIHSGDGDDTITTGDGSDTIDAGAGNDRVNADTGLDETGGDDSILGGDGDDTILAGHGNNIVSGGNGDDHIESLDGNDEISGGGGDDMLLAGDGNNSVTGGDGNDTLKTGAGNDTLYGNGGRDELRGGFGSDFLNGGGGRDKLFGQQGKDHLFGGNASDQMDGGPGDDLLSGGAGNDKLFGGSGNDQLSGNAGIDQFNGISGNDTLFAQDGNAELVSGGSGVDVGQVDSGVDDVHSVETIIP